MRYWSSLREVLSGVSKSQLQDTVNATDAWIEDNQVSYNTALPNPFKTNATQAQKTILFCCVAAMRVSPAFARMLLGEVD
jgi:hypothetical protein